MSYSHNPFIRGFQNLRVERTVGIAAQDGQLIRRPLSPGQASLSDDRIGRAECVYNGDAVVILDQGAPGDPPDVDLGAQFPFSGLALFVVYSVIGERDGQAARVGDLPFKATAEEVARRLNFETGVYSRAWEISSAHLTAAGERFLTQLADDALTGYLFVAFRIPGSPAIGVKLFATPWTDAHLQCVEGISADALRQENRDTGVPDALADVLHLAGQADVRFLVFDGDAPVLDSLPVYDDL
jgi:hypothetical protein